MEKVKDNIDPHTTIHIAGVDLSPEDYHAAFNAALQAHSDSHLNSKGQDSDQAAGRTKGEWRGTGPSVKAQTILRAAYGEPAEGLVKNTKIYDAANAIAAHAGAVARANKTSAYAREPEVEDFLFGKSNTGVEK